jgi:hypothetical protein
MSYLADFVGAVADDPESPAKVIEHAPRRDRERLLMATVDLRALLGSGWKRRISTMLGCSPGALRKRKYRS